MQSIVKLLVDTLLLLGLNYQITTLGKWSINKGWIIEMEATHLKINIKHNQFLVGNIKSKGMRPHMISLHMASFMNSKIS